MILTGSRNSMHSVSESMDIPLDHIRETPYGVDHEIMRPLPDAARVPGTILFVGDSEDRNKGARYLIEACARLQHEMDFRLLFKDKKEKDMTVVPPLVWKHGLNRFVEYIDRVSTDELVRLYNSVQILVSPSLYEGFGLPAAEAMACGTAVIATTAGAFPEFIEDGRTGVLVPPGDPDALAAAIKSLLQDPARCAEMGAAASTHIRTNFTWQRTAKTTVDLYNEVLDNNRAKVRRGALAPPRVRLATSVVRQRWSIRVRPLIRREVERRLLRRRCILPVHPLSRGRSSGRMGRRDCVPLRAPPARDAPRAAPRRPSPARPPLALRPPHLDELQAQPVRRRRRHERRPHARLRLHRLADLDPQPRQLRNCRVKVLDLQRQVVEPLALPLQVALQRVVRRQRRHQLQLSYPPAAYPPPAP